MMPGDCFTIEPCLVQGAKSRGDLWDDGWTLATEVSVHNFTQGGMLRNYGLRRELGLPNSSIRY